MLVWGTKNTEEQQARRQRAEQFVKDINEAGKAFADAQTERMKKDVRDRERKVSDKG